MDPLPAGELRSNLGTWAVPAASLPQVARAMADALPVETFDPSFGGQRLESTYFDTAGFDLRKARRRGDRYLTLRLRCYDNGRQETYALSAKTESGMWRQEVTPDVADLVLAAAADPGLALPADLLARLQELTGGKPVLPAVTVCCRRYAVEDDADRLTLDVGVATDTGKRLGTHVLEFKSTDRGALPPGPLGALRLRPMKLSKFLWATDWR
jgi:hypothetical protein